MYSEDYPKLTNMNINRNNYEPIFMLYADNELSATQKQAVEYFAAAHPDLKAELDMLMLTVLPAETPAFFLDKESLFRTTDTASLVNMTNYEGYFVKYADDELTNAEKAATEKFVYKHPECQAEFELIQQIKYSPDPSILFPDKTILYRKEETRVRPVLVMWMRFAAAAVLILLAGLFWLQQKKVVPADDTTNVAVKEEKQAPVPVNKIIEGNQQQNISEEQLAIKTVPANPVEQPKKLQVAPHIQPTEQAIPQNQVASNEIKPAVRQLDPASENTAIDPSQVNGTTAANIREAQINQPPVIETTVPENIGFASKAASEDYIYVNNAPATRKSPLRGLLRKASRYVEQKNPLSPEHRKGGVFTASQEQ